MSAAINKFSLTSPLFYILFRMRVYRLLRIATIIQSFVNICLLNVKGRGAGSTALLNGNRNRRARPSSRLQSLRKAGILDRESQSTYGLRPRATPAVVQAEMQMRVTLTKFPVFH